MNQTCNDVMLIEVRPLLSKVYSSRVDDFCSLETIIDLNVAGVFLGLSKACQQLKFKE